MPQQECLVTRVLPDQTQAHVTGKPTCTQVSQRRLPTLVCVEKEKAGRIVATPRRSVFHDCHGHLDEGEWITSAGLQDDRVQMDATVALFDKPREQCAVTSFAFAFAAEENATTLRNGYPPTPPHPICGTAPNAPPRYFR